MERLWETTFSVILCPFDSEVRDLFFHSSIHERTYFSVNDIVSDYILFFEYSGKKTVTKIMSPLNDTALLNDTLVSCTLMNETEEGFEFYCEEYNPFFASLTLTFIYLPSLNVVAALYGQKKAGTIGAVFGLLMAVPGVIWYSLESRNQ